MFPYTPTPDDSGVRPLADEDQQLLLGLVHKYGVSSLMCALTGYGESSRASIFSANTLLSSTSAPSLAWTNSEATSQCRSDEASIHTQYTWPEVASDVAPMQDGEAAKFAERSWLDSPAAVPSPLVPPNDVTSHPSPRLVTPTTKRYQCPMCFLDNSPVGFGRKSDFKKHLHNFHGADVVWICRTKGCHLSFSTERAYSTHAKEAHRMKALPNIAARTDMCPQLVFSCGFAGCKDRLFEAHSADDASASRDKYFEHIAKHFEDGFDVNHWEYRVQVQNLMRQKQVKPIWKTCIWPKEKRQQLYWRPRSSGDLKRMLECRHLGDNISSLVRLAFILGTPPFTSSATPPPHEIDVYFQLPYTSQCLLDSPGHSGPSGVSPKTEEETQSFTMPKNRTSIPQAMLKLSGRQGKRTTRPSTPLSVMSGSGDTIMGDDLSAGPHPGTPFPIPNETVWPVDAPKFAPEMPTSLPKQLNTPVGTPMDHHHHHHHHHQQQQQQQHQQQQQQHQQQQQQQQQQQHQQLMYSMPTQESTHHPWISLDAQMAHYHTPLQAQEQPDVVHDLYDYTMNTSQTLTVRPGTPVPHKRPASWSRMISMESLRPSKKATSHGSPDAPPGMIMGM